MAKSERQDIESAINEILNDANEAAQEAEAPAQTEEAQAAPADAATQGEIEALKAERDEYRDRFMRALADAENARKRSDRDRREAENYGGSKLARDLLPVFDNLKRALDAATEEQKGTQSALIEGVELTLRELLNVFRKHGIEPVSPEVGEKFDPQRHEAMFEAPVPGTKQGEIIQVMADGFMLHDRLLRPAHVGVSSTPAS
ncbi:nucleotide exchange factor GrpE [Tranquillimonas alkanivorans]|uniref:Protein GrpE n=1 Tax=Tranquillimonas alkanivorans TaxID=441119 RepID=A0A1I5LG52_9RHOB|nr:nucleotide exchange factor GrpE [Tranquillimonas alkanivorans]SFO96339.1 molecular chaperone GrpE [Tranquillimonas alkanivorans]